ncbi:clytin isoform X2 [Lingula anatina]|uniref:Clytin isoform X2 n=1 Tax=Lingula anatina TaxID=7574 RepID=A0A1S3I9E1_LINAN|nr:clytin isoform X2 [Lingula anatina]|eukprot:XP_013394808.1 clytin isoform X2 [Lingula anatina]
MLTGGVGSTLVIRDKKVQEETPSDIWAAKWRYVIDILDINGDGKLDKNEYINMMAARVGAITKSAEKEEIMRAYLQAVWDKWWKEVLNNENLVSFTANDVIKNKAEMISKFVEVHHLDIEDKWALTFFELVDENEDDALVAKEYANFLKIFHAKFSAEIFSEMDFDKSGDISRAEMVINHLLFNTGDTMKGANFYGKVI